MRPVKVMHILRLSEGGMKNHVEILINNINKKRFLPILVCPSPLAARMNVDCKIFNIEISETLNLKQNWQLFSKLFKIMDTEKPQLVHAHGAMLNLFVRSVAKKANVPAIITTYHNFIYDYPTTWLKAKLYSWISKYCVPQADGNIAVSHALAKHIFGQEGLGNDRLNVVYNGVDLKRFDMILDCHLAKEKLRLDISEPVVGVIARMIPQKGIHHFLRMADIVSKKLPGCQFLIIGNGPQRDYLIDLAYDLGIEAKIIFMGQREDVPNLLPIINVLVIPSLSEGLSITAIEAMASRRPIVAYDTGGLPELIMHEKTGLLVKKGDISYLAKAVMELLIHRQKAERLGAAARHFVEDKFTLEKMLSNTITVYENILSLKGVDITEQHAGAQAAIK